MTAFMTLPAALVPVIWKMIVKGEVLTSPSESSGKLYGRLRPMIRVDRMLYGVRKRRYSKEKGNGLEDEDSPENVENDLWDISCWVFGFSCSNGDRLGAAVYKS